MGAPLQDLVYHTYAVRQSAYDAHQLVPAAFLKKLNALRLPKVRKLWCESLGEQHVPRLNVAVYDGRATRLTMT